MDVDISGNAFKLNVLPDPPKCGSVQYQSCFSFGLHFEIIVFKKVSALVAFFPLFFFLAGLCIFIGFGAKLPRAFLKAKMCTYLWESVLHHIPLEKWPASPPE